MHILAVIPARGGSKGVPGKNILEIAGKPLINYTIEQCLNSKRINRIVVSTDDENIKKVSIDAGAEVVKRPEEFSTDTSTTEDAVLHVLKYLKENEEYEPDLVVILQATNPLRQENDIDSAIQKIIDENADSLVAAHYIHGFVWRDGPNGAEALTYDYKNRPFRQESSIDLIETGSFYVLKPEIIIKNKNRLGGKIVLYRMKAEDMFQIDEPEDIRLLEYLLSLKYGKQRNYIDK